MSISDRFCSSGVPYYRGQNIHDFFIESTDCTFIDYTTFKLPYMKRSHLKKGDVLLSIVATIGEVAVVSEARDATCNCKLAILRPKANYSSSLLAIFLRTKYGYNQVQKFKRGTVQMGYLLEDMDQIMIPSFSSRMNDTIDIIVSNARDHLVNSLSAYTNAQQTLESSLGLQTDNMPSDGIAVKSISEALGSSGRLDAEYYQPKPYSSFASVERHLKRLSLMSNWGIRKNANCSASAP